MLLPAGTPLEPLATRCPTAMSDADCTACQRNGLRVRLISFGLSNDTCDWQNCLIVPSYLRQAALKEASDPTLSIESL